jgi:hypothetical protein
MAATLAAVLAQQLGDLAVAGVLGPAGGRAVVEVVGDPRVGAGVE